MLFTVVLFTAFHFLLFQHLCCHFIILTIMTFYFDTDALYCFIIVNFAAFIAAVLTDAMFFLFLCPHIVLLLPVAP